MATDPILTLDDVVAGYGKMTILHGTTLSVARGAITTVIGPNGAGKSTVFKTVFGMLPARSGRVTFDGADITNRAPRDLLERGQRALVGDELLGRGHDPLAVASSVSAQRLLLGHGGVSLVKWGGPPFVCRQPEGPSVYTPGHETVGHPTYREEPT